MSFYQHFHSWQHFHFWQHPLFWLDLLFVALCCLVSRKVSASKWLFALWVLPGTALHEIAHWVVAFLLRGRPRALSLWPNFRGRRWTLGYVTIANPAWYNRVPIALAPLLLLPLAGLGYWHGARLWGIDDWRHWLALYGAAMVLSGALPSREDIELAQPELTVLGIGALVAAASALALHLR